MAAAAILDFKNFKFLTVGTVKRVEVLHRAKFRQIGRAVRAGRVNEKKKDRTGQDRKKVTKW